MGALVDDSCSDADDNNKYKEGQVFHSKLLYTMESVCAFIGHGVSFPFFRPARRPHPLALRVVSNEVLGFGRFSPVREIWQLLAHQEFFTYAAGSASQQPKEVVHRRFRRSKLRLADLFSATFISAFPENKSGSPNPAQTSAAAHPDPHQRQSAFLFAASFQPSHRPAAW